MRNRVILAAALAMLSAGSTAQAACCYFSAKNADILQPAQKVFITWDPSEKIETFTVQPKFEGNALDFGMVIPTPSQPKLHEMPKEFFKHLAIYTILKRRESPHSDLLPVLYLLEQLKATTGQFYKYADKGDKDAAFFEVRKPPVRI